MASEFSTAKLHSKKIPELILDPDSVSVSVSLSQERNYLSSGNKQARHIHSSSKDMTLGRREEEEKEDTLGKQGIKHGIRHQTTKRPSANLQLRSS
jgi:hypothetical protein